MARIPGGPRGGYDASEVKGKQFTCGCYPGQVVTIPRGLPNRCEPNRISVVGEYESLIVFKLEFDRPDTFGDGTHTVSWNYSVSKASLLCGDALVQDLSGRMIRPQEVVEEKPRRRGNGGDGRNRHGSGGRPPRRRPGDRMGMRDYDRDSDSLI